MEKHLKSLTSLIIVVLMIVSTTSVLMVPASASEGWIWPVTGQIFSRGVVGTHCAIDIAAPEGTTVCASRPGTVVCAYTISTAADWKCGTCGYKGAGYHVVIRHSDNSYSFYDHLSAVYTSVGAYVAAGRSVGAVGTTGNSTGPHLHFAISSSGLYSLVDPLYYVTPFSSVTAAVSENDVVLTGTFGAYGPTMQTAGFYIGTDVNNMTKVIETLNTDGYTNGVAIQSIFYSLAKWHNIAKGYTYYYKMYITRDGKEYCSAVYSFAYGKHTCTDATWGTGVVKTEPTCMSTGVRVYTCSVCNATKEETIPKKTTHTYGEWKTVTPATINAAGESLRYCTVNGCTAYESKVLPQPEHTHDFTGREEIVTPASCTAEGSKKVYCTNSECGEYTLVTLPKTGHTAGEWQVDGNKKVKKCTECGTVVDTLKRLPGDVDDDGKITVTDCLYLKRYILGTFSGNINLENADVDGNGRIDATDYLYLKRGYLGTFDLSKFA